MKAEIEEIYRAINSQLIRTPVSDCPSLDEVAGCKLHFKLENEQITGSFKLRGVLSKFHELLANHTSLSRVVAASTGNHALAVCHVAKSHGISPIIFVPETISNTKLTKLQQLGVEIHQQGAQSGQTEQIAINYSRAQAIPLIHPYNDPAVIAGQGTIGLELVEQLDFLDLVFVPVGGGGLISGIAAYLKATRPEVKIIGVQPKNASEMAESVATGNIVEPSKLPTVSDGTAGGLDPDTITYRYCRELVDEFILVEEEEIVKALELIGNHMNIRVEPAAALALAGILNKKDRVAGRNCTAVVCGGNIDSDLYRQLVE